MALDPPPFCAHTVVQNLTSTRTGGGSAGNHNITMTERFKVTEHRIPGQHIREYPHATSTAQETPLRLVIKQYTPLDNPDPSPGDITIIATHANAVPKEAYEPLWDDLLPRLRARGVRVRGVWVADMAHQGASAAANEDELGDDPHPFDHARDLLCAVNHFRAQMPRPLVGVGHSVGAAQLAFLSELHPRLFAALALVEPWMTSRPTATGHLVVRAAALRRDAGPTRAEAERAVRRSAVCRGWDARALDRMAAHALRATPTLLFPDAAAAGATLATPKHQEAFTAVRANFEGRGAGGELSREDRATHPDVDPGSAMVAPFYNTWRERALRALGGVRAPVLMVFGEGSPVTHQDFREELRRTAGVGFGGSGGAALGQLQEAVVPGGHFVAMESVGAVADELAAWLGVRMLEFKEKEELMERGRRGKSKAELQTMSREWVEQAKKWDGGWGRGRRMAKL